MSCMKASRIHSITFRAIHWLTFILLEGIHPVLITSHIGAAKLTLSMSECQLVPGGTAITDEVHWYKTTPQTLQQCYKLIHLWSPR